MAYYTVCHACGANLDPGEKCDCKKSKDSGQFAFVFDGISSTGYTDMKC